MKNFLGEFFTVCDYPKEAAVSLLADYDALMANSDCRAHFEHCISQYESTDTADFQSAYTKAGELAESVGMSRYPAELLIFCCFARHLREMYAKNNYPDNVWRDSMLDLRTKLLECHKMYGIWGTFVSFWFHEFFTLNRFALGRLQYQHAAYYATKEPYKIGGTEFIYNTDRALEMHIPSTGPLTRNDVIDSLKLAYDFFGGTEYVKNGIMACECSSWLLYPGLEDTLSPSSNVLDFKHNFDVVYSNDDEKYEDCWRVFNKSWDNDATALPRDTDMQRRIADRLSRGLPMGEGIGLLIFDGEKILTRNINR